MSPVSTLKGIILAGGNGTRLLPLTRSVNKHLLPIGGKPMLQHCVEKFTEAGITDIMVVTGGEHFGGIAEFLGSGKNYGCNFTFRVQDTAGGIAQALGLAEGFVRPGESMCVLLGDNIFEQSLFPFVETYAKRLFGAMVLLKEVPDPQRFGVPKFEGDEIVSIVEKSYDPPSCYAVTGIYFYDSRVFSIIRGLKPSGRGEMEITDVNNAYIDARQMGHVKMTGWWTDAGTHESYRRANELVNDAVSKQGERK